MKKVYYLALFMAFFMSLIPESKAIIMPIPLSISGKDSVFSDKKITYKALILTKRKSDNKANKLSKIAKILGFTFLGLLLLILIVPFQARLALALIALFVGLFSLIFALIGLGSAKNKEDRNKSLKSLWIVLGIIAGVIMIGLIIGLIALITSGFA
jgi:VIT1/CCC1 family predicted Fe2+/Mn2+ transporter